MGSEGGRFGNKEECGLKETAGQKRERGREGVRERLNINTGIGGLTAHILLVLFFFPGKKQQQP